jgi:phosphoribosylformylglycinamidine cyclo-ligase
MALKTGQRNRFIEIGRWIDMRTGGLTYASSGVDIDLKSSFINALVKELRFSRRNFRPAIGVGHFTSAIRMGSRLLTLSTDGVGSKMLIARRLNRWDTVGIDCIAMNVNDTICIGAEPLAIVDYIATPRLEMDIAAAIGKGLNRGAARANVTVVGGEVAVLTDMLNELDLSASCLGIVEKNRMITGSSIRIGDKIIGLPSSGLHSNGFTLVRRLLDAGLIDTDEKIGGKTIGEVLMSPTRIYVREVLDALRSGGITGLANITGGGMRNIIRLNGGLHYRINTVPRIPEIFNIIAETGKVSADEMFQTFNMGIGFVIICRENSCKRLIGRLRKNRVAASEIGNVEKGTGLTLVDYDIHYSTY